MQNITEIEDLIKLISKLPGLGPKSAKRIVLKIINNRDEIIKPMANTLAQVYKNVTRCNLCGSLKSNIEGCSNCENIKEKFNKICVVEDIRDLLAIENVGTYRGVYHVLGGVISPMDGVGPADINIAALVLRISELDGDAEVIFALPSTMEGDTTSFYLYKKLAGFDLKVTTLARGIAVGEALQHADEATLARSMDNRTLYEI